ncbi:MAG: acetyl-CoA carboxylase biotin carboxyl carrier protein subunit [Lachnospiraceae bacterium]|nr:acetyl-CoA carboxylase biotin carboxyl carrier protein subunit [Lachnospiraceae bacterium]
MKNYTITVNGIAYEVTVEENTGAAQAPAPKAAPKAAPAAPKAAPKAAPAAGAQGSVQIVAPMPGKILSVKVQAGDTVQKGKVVAMLEAMKMENEIVAPQDGTIVSVNISEGASVDAGALLATMN